MACASSLPSIACLDLWVTTMHASACSVPAPRARLASDKFWLRHRAQIFSTTGDTAALDRTGRRYEWLRRRLRAKGAVWALFPEAWRLPQRLCLLFAQATRAQLAAILDAKVWGLAAPEQDARCSCGLKATQPSRHPGGRMCPAAHEGPSQPVAQGGRFAPPQAGPPAATMVAPMAVTSEPSVTPGCRQGLRCPSTLAWEA